MFGAPFVTLRQRLAWLFVLAVSACASRTVARTPPIATVRPPQPDALLVASPLRVLHGDRVACALAADGRITLGGEAFARLDGGRVVSTAGVELARVEGTAVHFAGATSAAMLTADGLMGPDGQRLGFDPEGHPVFTDPSRPGDAVLHGTRVEGLTPASLPTAAVLVGVLMFRMRAQRADSP